jgi:glycosyltransferase involved in cell wall biosynthesis
MIGISKPLKNFISAIVPVYNDPVGIKVTLDSFLSQDYPSDKYEILVVDNNSSDNTVKVVSDYIGRYPGKISLLIEETVQSSYAARNKGILAAKGEFIAFLDSDMWADKNWFKVIAKSFEDIGVGYVGFNIEIHPSERSLVGIYNKLTGFPIKTYMEESHFAGAGCISVRSKVFGEIGLFDHRFISGGDAEFGDRCWRAGIGQLFVGGYLLHHPARESFRSLMKKEFRIGWGQRQLAYRYPQRFENRRRGFGNIKPFLPPSPIRLAKVVKKSDMGNISPRRLVALYFIGLGAKISRNLGYFYGLTNEKNKEK